MILIAVHINNPNDIPGRVELKFDSEQQCQQTLETMSYWLKFNYFKVIGQCKKS
jgi:hypothetical protein